MSLDFWIRALTILLFVILQLYWYLARQKSLFNKQRGPNKWLYLEKTGIILGGFFILVNLFGFTVLTFENAIIQILGLILVILGCVEAIVGRHILGSNWAGSYEYQIKKEHKLIVNGIYKYVRHPIYGGLWIAVTGAFVVAKTYLFIPIFFFLMIMMTYFARREENLLREHFGERYADYMKKTKMFILFIY